MEEDKKDNGGYEAEGNPLVGVIRERFQQAETSKLYDEKSLEQLKSLGYTK